MTDAQKPLPLASDDNTVDLVDTTDESDTEAAAERLFNTHVVSQAVEFTSEPMFSILFKDAVRATHPDDQVLNDYAVYVVPNLSRLLAHVTAKGGAFVQEKRAQGLSAESVARYDKDQSLRAHLINGLLPTAQVARTLKRWGQKRFEDEFDDTTYRLFCAGFTLHDWLKLPGTEAELHAAGLAHDKVNAVTHLPLVENLFRHWCAVLGIDQFLAPIGETNAYLHDLILIASNTQIKWGVMHNLSALPGLRARRRSTLLATDLATLADYLAYLGHTPVEAANNKNIRKMLERFSDDQVQARLDYHHLGDVRGVITSIVNNAAMDAYRADDLRASLLYAPTGVVYLARNGAPPAPAVEDVANAAIERVRALCQRQLERNLTGFGRSGKGLKYADYYALFFSSQQLARLIALVAEKRIAGEPVAGKRYASIISKSMVVDGLDVNLPSYIEVDRLAESCALLVKVAAEHASAFDAEQYLLNELGVSDLRDTVRTINGHRTAGGVPYGWYYAAGVARSRTQRLDEQQWIDTLHELARGVAEQLPNTPPSAAAGWAELRRYITDHLSFSGATAVDLTTRMRSELTRYVGARKAGRGSTLVCSLYSSPYTVDVQQEVAILFAPQVYTNKQPLHGSKAIRHICAVCSAETMLRQLLMKRSRESGGNFEKRKLRYLFFYPTYFFTPETLRMLRDAQDHIKRLSFTSLRKAITLNDGMSIDVRPETFQRMRDLMFDWSNPTAPEDDRLFRLHFEENEPITFSFVGIPPLERDAKDAEAWINPAFLALTLPLLLDIKVVASEGMLPIFNEASELPETIAFDGVHQAITYLVGQARLNLDEAVPALKRLVAAYLIHLDSNAKSGAGGYDYRWHTLPALARDLATSPLYAFHHLSRWQRREGLDSFGERKAALYLDMMQYLDPKGEAMTHARQLTNTYRRFYRAEKLNSNSILRPLDVAAKVILKADPRGFDTDDALREVVFGELRSFIDRVSTGRADGRLPKGSNSESREAAIREFSIYFIDTYYRAVFGGDKAALRGKQLNILKNACEAIYLDEWRKERASDRVEDSDTGAAEVIASANV